MYVVYGWISVNQHLEVNMSNNKQTTPIFTTSEFTTATIPQPKKVVGWYCLSTKTMVNTIAFATHSKPNFIKRFFMRTLLDFYWVKDKNNEQQ